MKLFLAVLIVIVLMLVASNCSGTPSVATVDPNQIPSIPFEGVQVFFDVFFR